MAGTETAVAHDHRDESRWTNATVAGLAAGVAFGLYLQFVVGVLSPLAGSRDVASLTTQWLVHLLHSVVFAIAYAELASFPPIADAADRPSTGALLGAGYGAVLWVVAVTVAFAFWTVANTVWILPIPELSAANFAGHVLYGVILGVGFAVARST